MNLGRMTRETTAPVEFDATIARLVVLTDAVRHALDLVEVVAKQLVPVAVEGDDDWVCYASSGNT